MGIVNPRPAMRRGEERRVRKNLDLHAQRMMELVNGGMDATAASKQAFDELFRRPRPAPPVYIAVSCTACSWKGNRTAKGVSKPCPKCKASTVVTE
jgi:hypothetical protein